MSRVKPPRSSRERQDRLAKEACELFAWLLARSGVDREAAWRTLRDKLRQIPASVSRSQSRNLRADHAAHVLTLWNLTPAYLDDRGKPIPLPVHGAAPSIEALIKLSRLDLTVDSAMDYLCATRAVRKRNGLYTPVSRAAIHGADTPYQAQHHMRVVTGMMRSVEANSRRSKRFFELAADGVIPASKRGVFRLNFRRVGMDMLQLADAFMVNQSKATKRPGRTSP